MNFFSLVCGSPDVARLKDDLFNSYDPDSRPVENVQDPVKVQVGLNLIHLAEVVNSPKEIASI